MTATTTKTEEEKKNDSPSAQLARRYATLPEIATPFQMALEPEGFDKAWTIASYMASIKFCGVSSPEEALARIMYGRNLGMTTMASLANVHVIENRPGVEAATMRGICLQRPDICEFFEIIESSPTSATVRGKRIGHAQIRTVSFTIEDAQRAKLVDRGGSKEAQEKNNWNRYPEDMCIARASARLARQLFPDLIRGFSTTEELRDMKRLRAEGIEPEPEPDVAASVPAAVVNSAPERDYQKEVAAFEAACVEAKTNPDFKKLRETFAAFGDAEPWASRMKEKYNAAVKRAKEPKADEPKPEEPAK